MRIFGKKSSFDTIIVIMLGAVLARGIVGASPFFSTVAAAIVMIAINRLLAMICMKSYRFACIMKGAPLLLYEDGNIIWKNMRAASLSKEDLMESLRLETNKDSLDGIVKVQMETNGRISFTMKQ